MTEYLFSVDPGKSSGAAIIGYNDTDVWLLEALQVTGGVNGFRGMVDYLQAYSVVGEWISEKFIPRPGGGFGQSLDSTLPLVCEGVLIDRGLMPEYVSGEKRWRVANSQYIVGGDTKAKKKARLHAFLKDSGFYRTGKDLGTADADDFRSAAGHGIAYLARVKKHKPSFALVQGWVEAND